MATKNYRVIGFGKLHLQVEGSAGGSVRTFEPGQVIALTDEQAKNFKGRVTGPINDPASPGQIAHPGRQNSDDPQAAITDVPAGGGGPSVQRALLDVQLPAASLLDRIRQPNVDADYLNTLKDADKNREGGPRQTVQELIDRKMKGLSTE